MGASESGYGDIVNLHRLFLALGGIISGLGLFVPGILLELQQLPDDQKLAEVSVTSERVPPIEDPEERRRLACELRLSLSEARKAFRND